ncbi:MAG: DUF302 domain-containing protein [Ignavibacteriae bacterium]|nr:DUF302 domain-containing protein [Ignavibacteriota bacterium]
MTHNSRNLGRWFVAVSFLVSAFLSPIISLAQDRVDKVSAKDFSGTAKAIEKTLKSKGFMIVATVDHQNMLKMVGAKIKGAKTIEFGKPDMMKMLMPMAPEAGLEMPGRFYIWERNPPQADKTVVSYYRPSVGFGKYGNEMMTKMGKDMDGMWEMIVNEATK